MAAKAAKKTAAKSRAPKAADSRAADSREEILAVATEEFAERGLSGARVDAIAERTRTSKRMIYYHFSGKEGLYKAVLERVYSEIRTVESQLDLDALTPVEAMRRMVELTFDYDENHPNFIRLVAVENINQGDSLKRLGTVRKRYSHVIEVLKSILERGQASGDFRTDVDALDVRLVMGSLCFFRVSNRHTFGALFDCDLSSPELRNRHRKMFTDAVLRFVKA
jgi:AcrR family transcriptional regulator